MLERIIDRRNIEKALEAVERNGGAAGIDNLQSDELRQFLYIHYQWLCQQILEGAYQPKPVRKVEIPKPQGGVRMLGIPKLLSFYLVLQTVLGMFFTKLISVKNIINQQKIIMT